MIDLVPGDSQGQIRNEKVRAKESEMLGVGVEGERGPSISMYVVWYYAGSDSKTNKNGCK